MGTGGRADDERATGPERKALVLAKPPKPISEMTPEERRAFAAELAERMIASVKKPKR